MPPEDDNPQSSRCTVVRAGTPFTSKQGLSCAPGISAETADAKAIHLEIVTIAPGARAKAHKHAAHETAIYILSGEARMYVGEHLEEHVVNKAGDFIYIPANMPHLHYNPSATVPCVALVARTDPNEQESVVLLPELDKLHP